jgi:glucose-1-phosphate adenylyltransferase
MENVLTILLAGGAGERLYPLTRDTAKPGVPFGGAYRIIDFTLSNCINSDLRRILILTQYKALELNRHIRDGWNILSPELGEYIEVLSPMKRIGEDWYRGTADAVYQNSQSIAGETPDLVLILSADHIYKMNYLHMVQWHLKHNADITLATIQLSPEEAHRFGVCRIERDYRVTGFEEKPKHGNPQRSVFNPEMISASMGIYIFNSHLLMEELARDASDPNSKHDFGIDVLPNCLNRARVIAYDFIDMNAKAARYWRDVGTLDSYYEANMDLVSVTPEFNLYDHRWPIRTRAMQQPPAKFVFAQEGQRMGLATDSIVSSGCIISGGRVNLSVLSPGVRVNSFCEIERSILLPNAEVGRHSRVHNAILDSGAILPEGSRVGLNQEEDRAAGYVVTEGGVTVVPGPSHELVRAAQ